MTEKINEIKNHFATISDKQDFKKSLSANLRHARESKEYSQREVASALGLTPASLSSYEKGNTIPSLHVVACLALIYDISIDSLCGIKDERKIPETFSDVIKLLFLIKETKSLSANINIFEGQELQAELTFTDKEIISFFDDWEKMQSLRDNNSIDDEVFDLWIEKTLKKYDKDISKTIGKRKFIPEGFEVIDDSDVPF